MKTKKSPANIEIILMTVYKLTPYPILSSRFSANIPIKIQTIPPAESEKFKRSLMAHEVFFK